MNSNVQHMCQNNIQPCDTCFSFKTTAGEQDTVVGCTAHFWISLIVKAAAFRLSNSNAGSGIHEWTTKTATETKETLCQGAFRGCLELQHHHRLRCSVILNQMPLMSERTVWRLARPQGPVFWSNALNHFSDVEWVKAFSYVAAYT